MHLLVGVTINYHRLSPQPMQLMQEKKNMYGARRHRGWVCQLQRNLFCMGIRENSTVRLGASTIMGVDLPISID
jgi:hypothetical protein